MTQKEKKINVSKEIQENYLDEIKENRQEEPFWQFYKRFLATRNKYDKFITIDPSQGK